MNAKRWLIATVVLLGSQLALAGEPLVLRVGGKLHNGTWRGENVGQVNSDFESDPSTGIGLSLALAKGPWFAGFTLQSGDYTFKESHPNPDLPWLTSAESESTIGSGFFAITSGYRFNRYLTAQAGFKSFVQTWRQGETREVRYGGIGAGVTGYWPISHNWTAYANLGVNSFDIQTDSGESIGDASATSLELGGVFRLSEHSSLSFGLRSEQINSQFDTNGVEQEHRVGNIFLGYNRAFVL